MSIPSTIAEYLSCFSQELGDRILQIYPALQAPQDPVSERFKTLFAKPLRSSTSGGDGHRGSAGIVPRPLRSLQNAEPAKTLMALSAIHVRSAGSTVHRSGDGSRQTSSGSGAERF